jgi:ribosome maturation factor RimP
MFLVFEEWVTTHSFQRPAIVVAHSTPEPVINRLISRSKTDSFNLYVLVSTWEAWSSLAKGGKTIEALVEELARPIAEEHGLDVAGVELVKEGANRYLRVYIDKEGGVNFEDCESVSRALDPKLDEALPNPPYEYFEVSSPGLERPLKSDDDFARYAGQTVAIATFAPVDGQKLFIGELVGLVNGEVVVKLPEGKTRGHTVSLERKRVSSARLHVDF